MALRDYFELWRLAGARRRSEEDYRVFQAFQARLILRYLERQGVETSRGRVLDLGSGVGGYGSEFARGGADVVAVDLGDPGGPSPSGVRPVQASALALPFGSETFDFVFCASLIEHVPDPALVLSEIERVLKPRGFAYVSFPPYWSPIGGHQFSPYHYLGERLAIRLAGRRGRGPDWAHRRLEVPDHPQSFAELFGSWGLYRMTVAGMRRLIAASRLECLDLSTRYLPVSFVRWPVLGEVLTWHAQFLLRKRRS